MTIRSDVQFSPWTFSFFFISFFFNLIIFIIYCSIFYFWDVWCIVWCMWAQFSLDARWQKIVIILRWYLLHVRFGWSNGCEFLLTKIKIAAFDYLHVYFTNTREIHSHKSRCQAGEAHLLLLLHTSRYTQSVAVQALHTFLPNN